MDRTDRRRLAFTGLLDGAKRDEEVPPYMQLRLNNIAERDAAMKAAEDAGLF